MATEQVLPPPVELRGLARGLVTWYLEHGRKLPWRDPSATPWHVLIAEVLLRQTSARHVEQVYAGFVERAPTPSALLALDAALLAEILIPLGLQHQRTAALRALAETLVAQSDGCVPPRYTDLVALPHVGPYAAGATLMFASGGRFPLPDVNVGRVGSRYFGSPLARTKRDLASVARRVLRVCPKGLERPFFYGLLDLSAELCRPKPRCAVCPLSRRCAFRKKERQVSQCRRREGTSWPSSL